MKGIGILPLLFSLFLVRVPSKPDLCVYRKPFQALLYSNVYIAGIAMIMVGRSQYVLGLELAYELWGFLFFATLAVYGAHSLWVDRDPGNEKDAWNMRHRLLHRCLVGIAVVAVALLWIRFPRLAGLIWPLLPFTAYYFAPVFASLKEKPRYFKTATLAFVWTYATLVLPAAYGGTSLFSLSFIALALLEYVYIYLIGLYFDYRDKAEEKLAFVFYNPFEKPYRSVAALGVAFALLASVLWYSDSFVEFTGIKSIGFLLLLILSRRSLESRSDSWFYGFLDGMMGIDAVYWFFG